MPEYPFDLDVVDVRYQVVTPTTNCFAKYRDADWYAYVITALDFGINISVNLEHLIVDEVSSVCDLLIDLIVKSKEASSTIDLIVPSHQVRNELRQLIHNHNVPVFDSFELAQLALNASITGR